MKTILMSFLITTTLLVNAQFGTFPYEFYAFNGADVFEEGEGAYAIFYCSALGTGLDFSSNNQILELRDKWSGVVETSGVNSIDIWNPGDFYLTTEGGADTIYHFNVNQVPAFYYDTLKLATNYYEPQNDTIYLCDDSFSNELIFLTDDGVICYFGFFGSELEFFHNGKRINNYNISKLELMDGDSVSYSLESYPYGDGSNIDCNCYETFNGRKLYSATYYIKRIQTPPSKITLLDTSLCPGETINVELAQNIYTKTWRHKPFDGARFSSKSGLIEPGKYYAYFKESQDQLCYTFTDTISIYQDTNCDGYISGLLYHDTDANNIKGFREEELPNKFLEIQPSGKIIKTNTKGWFNVKLESGQKHFLVLKENAELGSDDTLIADFTDVDNWNYINGNIGAFSKTSNDVEVFMNVGRLRPGFESIISAVVRNTGSVEQYVKPVIRLDTTLIYIERISGMSYNIVDNVASTNFNIRLLPQESIFYKLKVKVPADVNLLGKDLLNTVAIKINDDNPVNDSTSVFTTVTGSYDPNDKSLFDQIGSTESINVTDSTELLYTIRFQNTGTDTAFNILVVDTISDYLDVYSTRMIEASHQYDLVVDGQKLIWKFNDILLPDSIVDESGSHGYIIFSIKQKKNNPKGTIISNKAEIFFDFNPPIITNTINATIGQDFILPVNNISDKYWDIVLTPNPAKDIVKITTSYNDVHLIIFSSTSQKVIETIFNQKKEIDISHLKNGKYLFQLSNGVFSSSEWIIIE